MVDPLGNHVVQAHYNTHGRLDSLKDAQDRETVMQFVTPTTNAPATATITDPSGAWTTLTFRDRGTVTQVTDVAGHITTTDYGPEELPDQPDLPTTITQIGQDANGSPLSLTTTLHYDPQGNVDRSTDPAGMVTYVTYDRFGQPRTITDPLGNTVTNDYDDQGNLKQTISPIGVVTTYQYENGNLKQVARGGNVSSFTYEFGWLNTSTDPNNLETAFTHDANGNPTGSSWTWENPDNSSDTHPLHAIVYFDANDRPFRDTDAQGNTSETTYDPLGRAFRTKDTDGEETKTVYDDRSLVIQTTSPTGLITRTYYDETGRPSYTTDPYLEGDQHVFGTHTIYTADGQVWKTQRVKDLVISLTGTAPNQRSELTSGGTVVSTQETQYDSFNRVTLTINQYGLQTQYCYNNVGQQVQVRTESKDEEGSTVWLVQRTLFDDYGRVSIQTDPYLEDADSADILGTRTRYDDRGRVKATDRLRGVQVDLTSDNNTVLLTPGMVLGTTQTGYNDQGQVNETVAANGGVTNYKYDERGRPSATIGPLVLDAATGEQVRHRTETVYDANGHVWKERTNIRQSADGSSIDDSQVRETTHTYDPFGKRVRTTFADNSTQEWTYNTFSEVETETDQVGNTRGFEYQIHQLAAVTLPEVPDPEHDDQPTAPRYTYEYDAFGNQKLIRDALGRETKFEYDRQGHLTKRTLPLGHSERFVYDDLGREKLHISFEGVFTASSYDSIGRLSKKEYFSSEAAYDDADGTPAQTVEYVYDAFSRLVRQTTTVQGENTPSATTWTYDLEGRVRQIASPEGTINYEYDDLGRKTRMYTGSAGNPIDETHYTYDVLGRLETVTVWARNGQALPEGSREVTQYGYDLVGNLARVDQPNGLISIYEYDTVNRLEKLTHYLPADEEGHNAKLAEFDYQPRLDGKQDSVTETEWLDGTPHVIQVDWTYDAVGRLTDEVFNHYDNSSDYTAHYIMDLVGNRLRKTVDHGSNSSIDDFFVYGVDDNDRLLTEEQNLASGTHVVLTYSYGGTDNPATYLTGNTTTDASTHAVLETVTYSYNLAGRLSQVVSETYAAGDVVRRETATFGYCECGLRTQAADKVETDADNDSATALTVETETQTVYLNDPHNPTGYSQVIKESVRDVATGEVTKQVVTTVGLDVVAQTTFRPDGLEAGATRVLVSDGHGSTRLLTDAAGFVLQVYAYDAYGIALGFEPGAALTSLLYSGEQFEQHIGMQYLRGRYYDPRTGAFPSRDVFWGDPKDPQSFHKYLYTKADPVNGLDPSGLETLISAQSTMANGVRLQTLRMAGMDAAQRWGYTVAYNASTSAIARIGSMGLLGLIGITSVAEMIAAFFPPLPPSPAPAATSNPTSKSFVDVVRQTKAEFETETKKCKRPTQIHYDDLDSIGRAQGFIAVLNKDTVGGPYSKFDGYPGWWDQLPVLNFVWARGHLLGSQLGGIGKKNYQNLVALSPDVNLTVMRDTYENEVRAAAETQCVLYLVLARYIGDDYHPATIAAIAVGDNGFFKDLSHGSI